MPRPSEIRKPVTPLIGGRCGYWHENEFGSMQCVEMGIRLTVKDPLGNLMSIVRCHEHSDWVDIQDVDPLWEEFERYDPT